MADRTMKGICEQPYAYAGSPYWTNAAYDMAVLRLRQHVLRTRPRHRCVHVYDGV